MQTSWVHRNNKKKVIVFCNGWGMDSQPFLPLAAKEVDVLILSNFTTFDNGVDGAEILRDYSEKHLIGWSMGVWAGQQLFKSQIFTRTVAINGTCCPIDDRLGIPTKLLSATLANWSEPTQQSFYRRMCGDTMVLKTFLDHQPTRSVADQQAELAGYYRTAQCVGAARTLYTDVIISDDDRIMPTTHQYDYWQGKNILPLRGGHFPFYSWSSWDALLEFLPAQPANYG